MFCQKSADLIGNFNGKFINQTRRAQKSPSNKDELMLLVRQMPIFLCSLC